MNRKGNRRLPCHTQEIMLKEEVVPVAFFIQQLELLYIILKILSLFEVNKMDYLPLLMFSALFNYGT